MAGANEDIHTVQPSGNRTAQTHDRRFHALRSHARNRRAQASGSEEERC